MADASLKWRAQTRLHELSEANIPEACLSAGFAYPMNLDRYGNHVLLLRLSKTGRLPLQDVRRLLIFMVESLLRKQNASRITLLVDCAGADRRQLDLARFLAAIFRCYYPRWDTTRTMEHNASEVQMWKGQLCILSTSAYLPTQKEQFHTCMVPRESISASCCPRGWEARIRTSTSTRPGSPWGTGVLGCSRWTPSAPRRRTSRCTACSR
ncbi:unnamed protein product, partial [Ixodes pacificus]